MITLIIVVIVGILLTAFVLCLLHAAAPPKEKCPKCGGPVYPVELDNSTYRECTKCGWHSEDVI